MSTYYELRCGECAEQGGFFSRQAWGWGNADVIENTKFLMTHADCGKLSVLIEHDDEYGDEAASAKWRENIREGDASHRWPHDNWKEYAEATGSGTLFETWTRIKTDEWSRFEQ